MEVKIEPFIKVKASRDTPVTADVIESIIRDYGGYFACRARRLRDYYCGVHPILARAVSEKNTPNNKLVCNYAKHITDIASGYFMGVPITYSSNRPEYLNKIFEVLDRNFEEDLNYEITKTASIYGSAYELSFIDEAGNIKLCLLDNGAVIPVYSDDILEELLFVIRLYTVDGGGLSRDAVSLHKGNGKRMAEVYTAGEIVTFLEEKNSWSEVSRNSHFFGRLPVVEYLNNEEHSGDFELVVSLVEAYNKAQSDSANDFEYFTDAYLVLSGMGGTSAEDIERLKANRVMLLEDGGHAQWLIKNINDTAVENYKNRLVDDIHRLSQIPDLTDERFAANLSGVALKYKLWGIEQTASIKERKFRTAIIKRLELITNILNFKGGSFSCDDVKIQFHRNIPQNVAETVQMANDLSGIVSRRTQLEMLPFIDDVEAEMNDI